MKSNLLLVILSTCFCLSCNKEIDEDVCTPTMNSIANTYKLVGMKYKASASSPEQDYLALREPCEQDDLVTFEANGTVLYKDLNVKCDPNGDYASTWTVDGNNITIDGDAGLIQSFDCNTLVVTGKDLIMAGDAITYTFQKQ